MQSSANAGSMCPTAKIVRAMKEFSHPAREKNVNAAMAKIEALAVVNGKVTRIRLEELGRS